MANKEFSSRLSKLRSAAGLTQYALAKLAGITQTNLSKLEAGADPHLSTVEALATGLGCRVHDLVCEKNQKSSDTPVDRTTPV